MANKEMSTKELYFSLTQKYNLMYGSKTIVLMQVGSFFEVYGLKDEEGNISESLIEEYGKMCGLAVVEKKENYKKKKVVMAGFRDYIIDKYTSILEENGYTGVIYKQEEGNPSNRLLWKIVSPGTSFSSNVSINKYTNNADGNQFRLRTRIEDGSDSKRVRW